jgi:hypothetical protein
MAGPATASTFMTQRGREKGESGEKRRPRRRRAPLWQSRRRRESDRGLARLGPMPETRGTLRILRAISRWQGRPDRPSRSQRTKTNAKLCIGRGRWVRNFAGAGTTGRETERPMKMRRSRWLRMMNDWVASAYGFPCSAWSSRSSWRWSSRSCWSGTSSASRGHIMASACCWVGCLNSQPWDVASGPDEPRPARPACSSRLPPSSSWYWAWPSRCSGGSSGGSARRG